MAYEDNNASTNKSIVFKGFSSRAENQNFKLEADQKPNISKTYKITKDEFINIGIYDIRNTKSQKKVDRKDFAQRITWLTQNFQKESYPPI